MEQREPILGVNFYATEAGREPVREWIKTLSQDDRKAIGEDIKTVQFGWPLGMPLIRKIGANLWEIRSRIKDGIARMLFTVDGKTMVLLHGFIKKSQAIPGNELEVAQQRSKTYLGGKR